VADYKHSNSARRDLLKLTKYGIKKFGRQQARDYLEMLRLEYPTLGEHPNPGLSTYVPGRKRALWRLACGSHVIYYRRIRNYMFIVRILHKSQLPQLHLSTHHKEA